MLRILRQIFKSLVNSSTPSDSVASSLLSRAAEGAIKSSSSSLARNTLVSVSTVSSTPHLRGPPCASGTQSVLIGQVIMGPLFQERVAALKSQSSNISSVSTDSSSPQKGYCHSLVIHKILHGSTMKKKHGWQSLLREPLQMLPPIWCAHDDEGCNGPLFQNPIARLHRGTCLA